MRKVVFFILILSCTIPLRAQDFIYNASFKAEVGLPTNVTNEGFRELLQGLVLLTPSFQYTFENSFSIGGGLRYGYFNINEFKNNIKLTGGMHTAGIFAKVGQEKYYGDFGVDYGMRVGYSSNIFTTNKNKENDGKAFLNSGTFFEPMVGLSLKSDENVSFSLLLSYTIHAFELRPYQLGVTEFSGIKPSKLDKMTSYFTIGLGYSYFFSKK